MVSMHKPPTEPEPPTDWKRYPSRVWSHERPVALEAMRGYEADVYRLQPQALRRRFEFERARIWRRMPYLSSVELNLRGLEAVWQKQQRAHREWWLRNVYKPRPGSVGSMKFVGYRWCDGRFLPAYVESAGKR